MHIGTFVFAQIAQFLPQRQFRRILVRYNDRTQGWAMSHWNHLLVLMFGQLMGCGSLRELTDITTAHAKKSKHLGFGHQPVNRQMLSKANTLRDHRIFEEFAFYMMSMAQSRRITKEFELHGRFYAIDSTTIDLCMSVFRWSEFRSTKSGIRIHIQIDIVTEIPVFYRITTAKVHDVNSMDWFKYEPLACYVFDRGYFDLARLYRINVFGAFFIIREKGKPAYEIVDGESILDGTDNVLKDQSIRFTKKENKEKYPGVIRRIVYYVPELQRSFVYYTNTSVSVRRTSPCSISIGGRWSCSSNGSSSISRSNDSGENLRMQCAYRFMSPSLPTASLPLSSTTSRLAGQCSRSCGSLASLRSPRTVSKTCLSHLDKRQRRLMIDSFILISYLINIY